MLCIDCRADVDLVQVADNRFPLQKQDTSNQFLGMLHFVDGTFLDGFVQFFVPPVGAHLGLHHVLIDGRQLICQKHIESFKDFLIAFHFCPPPQDLNSELDLRLLIEHFTYAAPLMRASDDLSQQFRHRKDSDLIFQIYQLLGRDRGGIRGDNMF